MGNNWTRGHFHVNNKAKEDVIKLVESKGLKYDDIKTKEIANGTKIGYLKRNIMYYSKYIWIKNNISIVSQIFVYYLRVMV